MSLPSTIDVLPIEDSAGDAALIRGCLNNMEGLPVKLERVGRPPVALDRLADHGNDLLLWDLWPPDSLGWGAVRRFHHRRPNAPVVVITGLEAVEVVLEAVREGAADCLFPRRRDHSLLARAIRSAAERARARAALQDSERRYHSLFERGKCS